MLNSWVFFTLSWGRRKYFSIENITHSSFKMQSTHLFIHQWRKIPSEHWVCHEKKTFFVFLLQTSKISQQSSHLQNTFQPLVSMPLSLIGERRLHSGAWIWMLSGVKEWGSVMQCCLWHILCSAPCSNHTPDVPGLLLLSLNLRPTESASSRNLGPYRPALTE